MILDSLDHASRYFALNERLERAFAFIGATDFRTFDPGMHEVEGDDIFVNVMEADLKRPSDAKLEVHDRYLDIQVIVSGERERFGWSRRADMRLPLAPFDAGKDIQLFDDVPQTSYEMLPGQFSIFLPEDAHAPMIGEGHIRKIIVKVRV